MILAMLPEKKGAIPVWVLAAMKIYVGAQTTRARPGSPAF